MLSKLKCMGLVFVLLLAYSPIVAQNYNQKSYNDLQQELTDLTKIVNDKEWWIIYYKNSNKWFAKPFVVARNEYIRGQERLGMYNRYTIEEEILEMREHSDMTKWYMINAYIPQLKEQINQHPDNRLNPYNPNIDPYKPIPEPSGATSCHSRGKGVFWVGTDRLKYHCSYYSNGQLKTESPYVNNKNHGTKISYYKDGNVKVKTDYWNGHMAKQRWYRKTGKMYSCKNYSGDKYFKYLGSCMP